MVTKNYHATDTMERHFDLTVRVDKDGCDIEVYDFESGECATVSSGLKDGYNDHIKDLLWQELYSWIEMMKEGE